MQMTLRPFVERKRIQICHSDAGELSVVRRRGVHFNAVIIDPAVVANVGIVKAARFSRNLLIDWFDSVERELLDSARPTGKLN